MNFLGIKQILVINFILKMDFYFLFSGFSISWTARQFLGSTGTTTQVFQESVNSRIGRRVSLDKGRGPFCNFTRQKGYQSLSAARLEPCGPD